MLIRRDDFKDIDELTRGSNKNIWFICNNCGIGVLQKYKIYLKTDTDLCRTCRNQETANRGDVLEKHSRNSKRMWEDPIHREKMSNKLSKACKKAWDNDDGTRKEFISKNNPMKREDIKNKVAQSEAVPEENIKKFLGEIGYTYRGRVLGYRGGSVVYFICDNGHYSHRRLDALKHGGRCKYCNISSSVGEKEVQDFIYDLVEGQCEFNDKRIIYPYELDIIVHHKRLAIEYCGVYWHSETNKRYENYHLNKLNMCNEQGYDLITIFEDEWENKKDIVKERLKHKLGISKSKIGARKCEVKEIGTKEAKKFCNLYHIQGYGNSSIKLGLFHESELISVMTFSKPNVSKGKGITTINEWELNRFCSKYSIIGGFSKLLEYFKSNYSWNYIYSYVDRRWNTGNAYYLNGFQFNKFTRPNYWYCKTINNEIVRYHRFNFRKDRLEGKGTEKEIMMKKGWNVIWDCGNIKFIMAKKTPPKKEGFFILSKLDLDSV